MRPINYNNGGINMHSIAIAFIVFLVIIVGYRYIREAVQFVLLKLYEIFIQHKPV